MKEHIAAHTKGIIALILILLTLSLIMLFAFTIRSTIEDTEYGTVDWSTASQGYITFTASGQERVFVLQGPNTNAQTLTTVAKGECAKIALADGTGRYQYAIGNETADGKYYLVNYKNSFYAMEKGYPF